MGDIFGWAMKGLSFFVLVVLLFLIAGLAVWTRDARAPEERIVVFGIWAALVIVVFLGFLTYGLGWPSSASFVIGASLWGFFWKQFVSFFFGKEPSSL